MTTSRHRDIATLIEPMPGDAPQGRQWIVVIGIDHYLGWSRLHNAASDANGILRVFQQLGFAALRAPLLDQGASGDALRRLVTDELADLDPADSLVLFFAGHGHTVTREYPGGARVKDGYLIPVDGARPGSGSGSGTGTWLRLDSWLADIARCPAKHILILLDACHSGIALGSILRWRCEHLVAPRREPLAHLRTRRSRRIITSALDDQRAMDSGPLAGHSLFTGCLIEALTGRIAAHVDGFVTGSEIGLYVQRRVAEYPGSTQTPDYGALELDDRGELVLAIQPGSQWSDLPSQSAPAESAAPVRPAAAAAARRPASTRSWLRLAVGLAAATALGSIITLRANQRRDDARTAAPAPAARSSTLVDSHDGALVGAASIAPAPAPVAPADRGRDGDVTFIGAADPDPRALTPPRAAGTALSHGRNQRPARDGGRAPAQTTPTAESTATTAAPTDVPTYASALSLTSDSATPAAAAPRDPLTAACSKANFASVYNASAPGTAAVRAALRSLKSCRDTGLLSNDEFDRFQAALVARL